MDDAEALAFIAYLDRQMAAVALVLPPRVGPEPVPCPVCGMGRLACGLIFSRHRDNEAEAREFLARHPLSSGQGQISRSQDRQ